MTGKLIRIVSCCWSDDKWQKRFLTMRMPEIILFWFRQWYCCIYLLTHLIKGIDTCRSCHWPGSRVELIPSMYQITFGESIIQQWSASKKVYKYRAFCIFQEPEIILQTNNNKKNVICSTNCRRSYSKQQGHCFWKKLLSWVSHTRWISRINWHSREYIYIYSLLQKSKGFIELSWYRVCRYWIRFTL